MRAIHVLLSVLLATATVFQLFSCIVASSSAASWSSSPANASSNSFRVLSQSVTSVLSMAVDSDAGFVYLADLNNNRVVQLSSNGSFLAAFSVGSAPQALTVDSNGLLWVALCGSTAAASVVGIDPSTGTEIFSYNATAAALSSSSLAGSTIFTGIAVLQPNNAIFLAVSKFNDFNVPPYVVLLSTAAPNTATLAYSGSSSTFYGYLFDGIGTLRLCTGVDGSAYVLDPFSNAIYRLSVGQSSPPAVVINATLSSPTQSLQESISFAMDSAGRTYVLFSSEPEVFSLLVFTMPADKGAASVSIASVPLNASLYVTAMTAIGGSDASSINVLLLDSNYGQLVRVNGTGTLLASSPAQFGLVPLSSPLALAVGVGGTVVIGNSFTESYVVAALSGTGAALSVSPLVVVNQPTNYSLLGGGIYPQGMAVDASGAVYVTSAAGVGKFNSAGTLVQVFNSSAVAFYPDAVAVDSAGRVYVAGQAGLAAFNSDGSVAWQNSVVSQGSLALDATGTRLLLLNYWQLNSTTSVVQLQSLSTVDGHFISNVTLPTQASASGQLAVDWQNNVYVFGQYEQVLQLDSTTGAVLAQWQISAAAFPSISNLGGINMRNGDDSSLDYYGLCITPSGDLLITFTFHNALGVISGVAPPVTSSSAAPSASTGAVATSSMGTLATSSTGTPVAAGGSSTGAGSSRTATLPSTTSSNNNSGSRSSSGSPSSALAATSSVTFNTSSNSFRVLSQSVTSVLSMAVDSDAGFVYLADLNNNRVVQLSSNGSFLAAFSVGSAPQALTVDSNGLLWVALCGSTAAASVVGIDPSTGTEIFSYNATAAALSSSSLAGSTIFTGIAVLQPNNAIFLAVSKFNDFNVPPYVVLLSTAAPNTATLAYSGSSSTFYGYLFDGIGTLRLCTGVDGSAYVLDPFSNAIYRLSVGQSSPPAVVINATLSSPTQSLQESISFAMDSAGRTYVLFSSEPEVFSLLVFTMPADKGAASVSIASVPLNASLYVTAMTAIGGSDASSINVLLLDSNYGQLVRVNGTGTLLASSPAQFGLVPLSSPLALAVGVGGTVVIGNSFTESYVVAALSGTGAALSVSPLVVVNQPTNYSLLGGGIYPQGMAVDASGAVYVTSAAGVGKFNSAGTLVQVFNSSAVAFYPDAVAVDSAGRVYVAGQAGLAAFNSDGSVAWQNSVVSQGSLALDATGTRLLLLNYWQLNSTTSVVQLQSLSTVDGHFISNVTLPTQASASGQLAVDWQNNVYVFGQYEQVLQLDSTTGAVLAQWQISAAAFPSISNLGGINMRNGDDSSLDYYGLCITPSGDLLITFTFHNALGVISGVAPPVTSSSAAPSASTGAVATSSMGTLATSSTGTPVAAGGSSTGTEASYPPNSIAVVFVVDVAANRSIDSTFLSELQSDIAYNLALLTPGVAASAVQVYVIITSVNGNLVAAAGGSRRLLQTSSNVALQVGWVLLGTVSAITSSTGATVNATAAITSFQQQAAAGLLQAPSTGASIPAQNVTQQPVGSPQQTTTAHNSANGRAAAPSWTWLVLLVFTSLAACAGPLILLL